MGRICGRNTWRRAGVVACLCLGFALTGVLGQQEPGQGTLNLQDVDIRVLISTVSEVSGRNFVVDPRVKGNVSVISGSPLTGDQLYDMFLSILEVHNFAAVESGPVIKILPSNVIKQRPTPTVFSPSAIDNDQQITQIVQLEHASVAELVPIIRPLVPPTSHFAAHGPSNTLVMTDTAANISRVMEIVARIDIPDRRTAVHVIYLKHGDADELAATLTQLAVSMSSGPEVGVPGNDVTIQSHPSINALIINASDTEFATLMALIDQLDIERAVEGDVHVIYLKYAKAADLVTILNDVLQSAIPQEGVADVPASIQADDGTNSLIVHARDSEFRTLEAVIEKLDIRRAQVIVETIIAEVAQNQAADLGVEFIASRPNTPTGQTNVTTNFSDLTGGLAYTLLDNTFGNLSLDLVLRALNSDANSNILSTPTILTLDNEEAEIIVAQEVPFVTGSFSNTGSSGTGTVIGQGADGEVGAVTGVVNPFQTIERKDVGLTLRITPQINEGDTIILEVSQEISSISDIVVQGAADLITDVRSIKATVQVDDGQLVVLGGLIREDVLDTVEWVPILGKIPILGTLFRRKGKSAVKVNLLVFLKPRIIRTAADLAEYSRERYGTIRDQQMLGQPDTRNMIQGVRPSVLPPYDESQDWMQGQAEAAAALGKEVAPAADSPEQEAPDISD